MLRLCWSKAIVVMTACSSAMTSVCSPSPRRPSYVNIYITLFQILRTKGYNSRIAVKR